MGNQEIKFGNVKGDALGPGAKGVIAKEIHGNVYQIVFKSGTLEEQLGKLTQIQTEVQQTQMAGADGNVLPGNHEQLQDNINELLNLLKTSGLPSHQNNEIRAGKVHLSQVDLLLKKAILIKSEADQMYFDDYMSKSSPPQSNRPDFGNKARAQSYVFDADAHKTKLKEAYALLEEANALDPSNTEVLLHMAQLLMELTPDDPSDEQRLLFRIQKLLNNPKNDVERFRLAQTIFLLATTALQLDTQLLHDARNMFDTLGRTEWVRQCDDLMRSNGNNITQENLPFVFQPAGSWFVKTSDFVGSTMQMTLHPNGYFEATQQAGMYGTVAYASGQWVYNPHQRMLHLQGNVNNFHPFMLGIMVQYQQGLQFFGVGTDGYSYVMQKN